METIRRPVLPRRRNPRLPDYDYSEPGFYFVTLCSYKRRCIFGTVTGNRVELTGPGLIVENCWRGITDHHSGVGLDQFIIMPNHLHGIVIIGSQAGSRSGLGTVVGSFKSASTRQINLQRGTPGEPVWQRNYYEHVIRQDQSLDGIREYIVNNPINWSSDPENPLQRDKQP